MKMMEDVFYSGTFGGETLSLAASIAVIDKIEYVYSDQDTQTNRTLEFSIRYQQINSSNNAYGDNSISGSVINTNSFASSNKIATVNNLDFPIFFSDTIWRAFYVRVKPGTGGWTGNGLMAIQQVRIHYTY